MIKKQKEVYTSPTTEMLVVRFEQNLLEGSFKVNSSNHTEYLGGEEDGGELS